MLVVIDPGHGGSDSGAVSPGGLAEKDQVLAIANLIKSNRILYLSAPKQRSYRERPRHRNICPAAGW
jgi:hypothetical protein